MINVPGTACATCGHYACVCTIRREHEEACKYRRAAACDIPIACDHGFDVCRACDPCTCAVVKGKEP